MNISLIGYGTRGDVQPTLVCSVFADQPYWGSRVAALGVGATLAFKRFGVEPLVRALQRVLAPEVAEAARRLGATLAREDGLPAAVEAVERLAARPAAAAVRGRASVAATT